MRALWMASIRIIANELVGYATDKQIIYVCIEAGKIDEGCCYAQTLDQLDDRDLEKISRWMSSEKSRV